MKLTKKDVVKVYDEFDRRISLDIYDGTISDKAGRLYSREFLIEEYKSRLQGVYGTLMALSEDDNWSDVAFWCRSIEDERYTWAREEVDAMEKDMQEETAEMT